MRFTDNITLPCPSPEDYAAYALYMQRLAEAIEAKVVAQRALLDAHNNQPTAIWRNAVLLGPDSSSTFRNILLDEDDLVFANFTLPSGVRSFGDFRQVFPASGIYHVGWQVNTVETGAVTADSHRTIGCRVELETAGGREVVQDLTRRIQAEGVTGGSWFGTAGVVAVTDSALPHCVISFEFTHGNVASTVQIPLAGLTAWLTRVGSTEIVEVT